MKIALLGYGQMGKLIKELALERDHTIIIVDPHEKSADYKSAAELKTSNFDCAIDFSSPNSALANIYTILELQKPLIVGTTGWYESLNEVKQKVTTAQTGFIYATNFSPGVYLFKQIVERAAQLINNFPNYDVAGLECHHNKKADSPSGTAQTLSEILLKNIARKEQIVFASPDRKISANELQFVSMRIGAVPGTHQINFDSNEDSIQLTHTARNRSGFALGALIAAEWLVNKKGFFTVDDLFNNLKG